MRKRFFIICLCAMALTATACGGEKEKAKETAPVQQEEVSVEEAENTEDTEDTASAVTVTSYEDIDEIYQFDLEGKHYKLPCTIDDFLQNGCTINDSYLQETVQAQHSLGMINVHPDGDENKYVYLEVLNDTDQDMTVQECQKVIGITVYEDSEVSFVLNSGLELVFDDTFLPKLKETYGTDEKIYQENETSITWNFCNAIPKEDGSFVVYSMLQPGTDAMCVYNDSFKLQYISQE